MSVSWTRLKGSTIRFRSCRVSERTRPQEAPKGRRRRISRIRLAVR
jgi:hypothetical protein